jgi:PEP-CTERM motif
MNIRTLTLGAAALVVGLGSSAYAQQLNLNPPYAATLTVNPDGTLEYQNQSYTSVLQQDKLFSDFSGLAAGATILFSHSVVNGEDQHTIAFSEPFANNNAYSWSYDVTITDPTVFAFANVIGDILQNNGFAELSKQLTAQDDDTYSLDFTKLSSTGNNPVYTGTTSAALNSNDVILSVIDTLTIPLSPGSDVTGVTNDFLERPIPEPSTWAMMGIGFAGLAFAGYRARRTTTGIAYRT